MLSLLHIENIAVIECADLSLERGFSVLTGETGAGKSIVIDAISAILGERAYRDMIRTGCDSAAVSAVFTGIPQLDWFEETGVPYDEEELLISRQIMADGKNICKVNGRPVTVAILRQLGLHLINIHGQHDSQQLFDEASHLTYLDSFAHNESELDAYAECFNAMQKTKRELASLQMNESEKLRKTEMLEHQISEITAAKLKPGEEEQLLEQRKLLQNGEKLTDSLQSAAFSLLGGDDALGAVSLTSEACRELERISGYTDRLEHLLVQLNELLYNLQDTAEELRDLRDTFDFSPNELERVESRLDVLHRLKRKYGGSVEDILNFLDQAQNELDAMTTSEERIAKLEDQLRTQQAKAEAAAEILHETRRHASGQLQTRIMEELFQLDMPKVQFQCEFTQTELGADGKDAVRFLMSANIGEALKPLNKVASGGELARIMLAMKNVLAENDAVPTLIFDEVDAGVSGRAAQKVAEKLSTLAKTKQVLCVTHLPQLAAHADSHYLVSKHEADGRTYTSVQKLSFEGRTEELARIIGGAQITDITRSSAAEMLRKAR